MERIETPVPEGYHGTWIQHGSIRPWYEPRPSSVVVTCLPDTERSLQIKIRATLGVPIEVTGRLHLLEPGRGRLELPSLLFGINLNKEFRIRETWGRRDRYQLFVIESEGRMYVLIREVEVTAMLPSLLGRLGYRMQDYR